MNRRHVYKLARPTRSRLLSPFTNGELVKEHFAIHYAFSPCQNRSRCRLVTWSCPTGQRFSTKTILTKAPPLSCSRMLASTIIRACGRLRLLHVPWTMDLIDNDEHSVSMSSLIPSHPYFALTSLSTTDPLTLRDRALVRFVP